jgi:hypothetical protein
MSKIAEFIKKILVMTMRHIAQFIYKQNYGGSIKYEHFFTTVWKIGHNEGPKGFYGGLIPAILGNFFYSAGFATTMFILSRIITRIKVSLVQRCS